MSAKDVLPTFGTLPTLRGSSHLLKIRSAPTTHGCGLRCGTPLGWRHNGTARGRSIIACRGLLGLDSPSLIVEVKSEDGSIGSPVVRGLQGAMSQHRADQCLLIAWAA